MLLRLSSKGQLVIPKTIRQALRLKNGDQFQARVADGRLILEPVREDILLRLHGRYQGTDLLMDLEEEHRQEVGDE